MILIILVILTSPLFFYKLGSTSLTAWDEAWYGEIAKNILKTGEIFSLHFNDKLFFDHPPAGFWFIAVGEKLFGSNSLGVRIPVAIFGILTVVILYLLGKKMFSEKLVGIFSSLALTSSPWFLSRARSGNLDIYLTFFFVASVYLAFLARDNKKFLLPFSISLTFLFLTKTMIPFAIVPGLVLIFWGTKNLTIKDIYKPIIIFLLPIGFWFYKNYSLSPDLFLKNYIKIGLTGVSAAPNYWENLMLLKTYAHNGIGIWFRTAVVTMIAGALVVRNKNFWVLAVIVGSIFAPFVFSEKGHIWHMIPAYPFMLLSIFGFIWSFSIKYEVNKLFSWGIMTVLFLMLFVPQTRRNWNEFINIPAYVSDEEILGREAGKYDDDLILDDDFIPTIVFYSGKSVERTVVPLREYFDSNREFIMIVRDYRLNIGDIKEEEYEIIKKDRDKMLIRKL